MAKVTTNKVIKAATKSAKDKTVKADKADKPKRAPSAYQIFCKTNMKEWNEKNPGRAKEAMAQMALLWKDAPENPNRGQATKSRKLKAPKKAKDQDKAESDKDTVEPNKVKAKPRAKKAKKAESESEDEVDDSDHNDDDE